MVVGLKAAVKVPSASPLTGRLGCLSLQWPTVSQAVKRRRAIL